MLFDPFAQFQKSFAAWQKITEDNLQRATSSCAEIDKLEVKAVERATVAIDEASVLGKEMLAYAAQLGAEWRKLTFDAFQHASTTFDAARKSAV